MDRFVNIAFHIDANRINARCKSHSMNLLEQWDRSNVIMLGISKVAQREAAHGDNPFRTRKAHSYIASHTLANNSNDQKKLQHIGRIIFPKGVENYNQRNDVEIVFTAHKYFRILITNDGCSKKQPGGILGHAKELKDTLGIVVLRDNEAVDLVNREIYYRDQLAERWAVIRNEPPPHWIGKDNICY